MKTYNEMITEIDSLINSKEALDIYRERCELEIMYKHINNQLYLQEYTNKILCDELKLNMILEAANNKKEAWYQKLIQHSNKIITNTYNLISSIFKWAIDSLNKLWEYVSNMNIKETFSKVRNYLFTPKNESVFVENVDTYIQQIQSIFKKEYEKYKTQWAQFYKKLDNKVDVKNLLIEINGININNLFNNENVQLTKDTLQNLLKQDDLEFHYKWQDAQQDNMNNKFVMMDIDDFNKISNNMMTCINQAANNCTEATKLIKPVLNYFLGKVPLLKMLKVH